MTRRRCCCCCCCCCCCRPSRLALCRKRTSDCLFSKQRSCSGDGVKINEEEEKEKSDVRCFFFFPSKLKLFWCFVSFVRSPSREKKVRATKRRKNRRESLHFFLLEFHSLSLKSKKLAFFFFFFDLSLFYHSSNVPVSGKGPSQGDPAGELQRELFRRN